MSEILLVEIDFNKKTWYLSEEGFIGDNYYAPYLASTPEIELGQIKGGYINIRIGEMSIANRSNDRFSPFSIFGGGYSILIQNPTSKIPTRIYWRQNDTTESIFTGTMYLSSFDIDQFNFILEDNFEDVDLLTSVSDVKAEFEKTTSIYIRGLGSVNGLNLAEVVAPDHGLFDGDYINVANAVETSFNTPENSVLGERREVTIIDENTFTYEIDSISTIIENAGTYTISFLSKKNVPFSFGVVTREKGLIQKEDGTVGSKGFAYSNPSLKLESDYENPSDVVPILLFDDGVLVGSSDSSSTRRTIYPVIGASGVSVAYDIVTITTQTNHGLTSGSVVKITGLLPDGLNSKVVGFPIIDAPSSTTFTYFNNTKLDSGTVTEATSSAEILFEGEYYGDGRLPTEDTIFSRAVDNTLAQGQTSTSVDGSFTFDYEDGVVLLGTALVSGESKNGSTLADFFSYVARRLGVSSADFKYAPNASSLFLQLWETSQTKILDYAGEVALSANHLFEIKNNILRVIDREYIPENFYKIENYNIISASYKMPNPIKALRSKWNLNIVNTTTYPANLDTREESVMISNSPSGEIRDVIPISKNINNQREMLFKIRNVVNKVVVDITIGGIRSDLLVGDRIKFNREEDGLSVDMVIRTISFDFSGLQTKLVGDSNITVIEQDSVY